MTRSEQDTSHQLEPAPREPSIEPTGWPDLFPCCPPQEGSRCRPACLLAPPHLPHWPSAWPSDPLLPLRVPTCPPGPPLALQGSVAGPERRQGFSSAGLILAGWVSVPQRRGHPTPSPAAGWGISLGGGLKARALSVAPILPLTSRSLGPAALPL